MTDDEATFREHAAELTRYAAAIAGPTDADDVVADAFAAAFASSRWPAIEDRRAYLYQAVLNQVRDRHRSNSRRQRREATTHRTDDTSDSGVRPEVLAVMNALTTRQRAVLFCLYWLDLDVLQTAHRLDLSTRTVQRESQTARRHMKALLR
ncbi:MAG: sigma factor [Ilumatobacter sp.]|uniref:RNA polymerase sigma factor n=1 Tax=Ilumatobacter sp. TaxID=1967498 RepID=UPI003298B67E